MLLEKTTIEIEQRKTEKDHSLLDYYVKAEVEIEDFFDLPEDKQEILRNIFLMKHRSFKGKESYKHFKHIFGFMVGNQFIVSKNNAYTTRHYNLQDICDCSLHINKNELVGTVYTINFSNWW